MGDKKRQMLIERSYPLQYIKESGTRENGKHYLGKLAGPAADFKHATRNGRRYPYELWINVENSDDFREGMSTLTIFGEADHPETRVDTSIKEIAIVLTKFEIRKDEGIVYCEFDILDTPNGRILKELLDYGSQIGVSSRGIGDEINRNGENIIDPDTYIFYGFDAVVMPAVKSARPAVVESPDTPIGTTLHEKINIEIDSAASKAEVESIKRIVESAQLPDSDSIMESIENKLSMFGDNISNSSNLDLTRENEELREKIAKLESKLSANNIRIKEYREQLRVTTSTSRKLSKILQDNKVQVSRLEESVADGASQIDEITRLYEKSKKDLSALESKNRRLIKTNSRLENITEKLKRENNKLSESLDIYESQVDSLDNKVSSLSNRLVSERKSFAEERNSYERKIEKFQQRVSKLEESKQITESSKRSEIKKIMNEANRARSQASKATNNYINVVCAQNNLRDDVVRDLLPSNFTTEDVDKIVAELSDRQRRLGKVPVAMKPRTVVLNESIGSLSDEDRQTWEMLKNFNQNN